MNDFFPTEDYKIPVASNYMKLLEGENRFRVLSSAVIGWEYWNVDNKPVRSKDEFDGIPADIKLVKDKNGKITPAGVSHFWAFVVWNYDAKRVQILEIKQKGIMQYIQSLVKNPKWGSPKGYDLVITRTGSGFDTEYSTVAEPHSVIDYAITEKYESMNINLEALYTGDDPFAVKV